MEEYIDMYGQIAQSIMNSMHTIQKESFKNSPITPDQFNILNEINARETCSSSLLAKELNVKNSTTTAVVNRLSVKGLVTCINKENDRRVMILKLTEKGKNFFDEERKKVISKLMPLSNKVTEAEFEYLRKNFSLIDSQLKTIIKGVNKDEN